VLTLLVKLYEASAQPSWVNISQCLVFLDQPGEVANILHRLLRGSEVCSGLWFCFRLAFLLASTSLAAVVDQWFGDTCRQGASHNGAHLRWVQTAVSWTAGGVVLESWCSAGTRGWNVK